MTAYLRAQRSWLTVERLPGYAPELNPTELVWGNVKGRGANSPTSAPNTSARSSRRSAPAFAASGVLRRWRSRFSDIPGFLFDRNVTILCEIQ